MERGGYYFTSTDTADVIVRTKTAADNATPAGNGVMVGVLARLFYVTGNAAYREKADRIIAAFSGELNRNFFGLCTLLNQNELLQTALQAVLVGPADSAETQNSGRRRLWPVSAEPDHGERARWRRRCRRRTRLPARAWSGASRQCICAGVRIAPCR